ncbi:MAG: GNAT family N-acetyltransferase [Actinomycetota bacterium]|nr:GNAT family N-acetyltransferase [Actinomycetota bacterium]
MITPLQPRSGLPDGYPFDYERRIDLKDGRTAYVRPVVPADAALLADEIEEIDADTLYQRFFNPAMRLDRTRVRLLTELDYHSRFALAAFVDGVGVAIARFEPSGEGRAEIAIVVKPDWRRFGLATKLISLLEEAAVERGIGELEALYLAQNHAIERVLEKRGFGSVEIDSGVARVTKMLRSEPS